MNERRKKIKKIIAENNEVTISKLANRFGVSDMTIRRDLKELEKENLIVRTKGGAVNKNILNDEEPFRKKQIKNKDLKKQISSKIVQFIKPGQTIFLDAGTTTLELAKKLKCMDITVITNDIYILVELFQCSSINLISVGGKVQNHVGAMIGNKALDLIRSVYVDYAFLGADSISYYDLFLTTPTIEKVSLKKAIIESANESILLADSTKFGKKASYKICHISELDYLITDNNINESIYNYITNKAKKLKII